MNQLYPWLSQSEYDEDKYYEEQENLIKDCKTAIFYLEELQKCFLTVSYTDILSLASRIKNCVDDLTKKQKILVIFPQKNKFHFSEKL